MNKGFMYCYLTKCFKNKTYVINLIQLAVYKKPIVWQNIIIWGNSELKISDQYVTAQG